MARLVMKFGGTSVANIERIRNVARHVEREVKAGYEVAVVVSAMTGKTNELVAWCREASLLPDAREYDVVVASGEQVTAGLLAIALQDIGISARSWQGWQIPILTDEAHGSARIVSIDGSALRRDLAAGQMAVITGFQGIHKESGRISTLGRGGIRHQRRRRCRGHRSRSVRHLYRCRRRLHHRPQDRAEGTSTRSRRFRGNA